MSRKLSFLLLLLLACSNAFIISESLYAQKAALKNPFLHSAKPWTRWWWFASIIKEEDVRSNLEWLAKNGFGGVEVAWVYPLNRMQRDTVNVTPRQPWLSREWSDIVAYTKRCCDSMGLGCDFTFGSLWPFGDASVSRDDATRKWGDDSWRQLIRASWDYPKKNYVVDHLNTNAFARYADRMLKALPTNRSPIGTAFFVDSWEVETRHLWTPGFDRDFTRAFGYDIRPFMDSIYTERCAQERYDYFSLLSKKVLGFYKQFTSVSQRGNALSRAQCMGAPCDIMSAYAAVDIPESEAMLYEPDYSRIVASAAAMTNKPVVTAETFTCLYGWPRNYLGKEQTADLKLVADALFANGVNHIIWHGKPFNPANVDTVRFYASVHVGAGGSLEEETPAFNRYMEIVSTYMRRGRAYSDVAVYLPTEDAWIAGDLPKEKQFIWAWGEYEMRYVYPPDELRGYQPLWINRELLERAKVVNGKIVVGEQTFDALYIGAKYLDRAALAAIEKLARRGAAICLKHIPMEPGRMKSRSYPTLLASLVQLKNVKRAWHDIAVRKPLVECGAPLDYWCRVDGETKYIFIAHPLAHRLTFPSEYGQSLCEMRISRDVTFNVGGKSIRRMIIFEPYQSLLFAITPEGDLAPIDITFIPKTPVVIQREKKKEAWQVE